MRKSLYLSKLQINHHDCQLSSYLTHKVGNALILNLLKEKRKTSTFAKVNSILIAVVI